MSVLLYKRPDYVPKLPGPMSLTQIQIIDEKTHMSRTPFPPKLSFENIIQNKAPPPCSLQDFLEYLVYVSRDAETLQFWLWLQDYTQKFYADSPAEQALSPPWSAAETLQQTRDVPHQPPKSADKSRFGASGYNFEQGELLLAPSLDKPSFISGTTQTKRSSPYSTEDANEWAGLKRQSSSTQPHRYEVNRIISHYLAPDSPRELNLSPRTRAAVLDALQHTTHPSAFSPIRDIVESTLRARSHPNFIRWSIRNANEPRARFVLKVAATNIFMTVLMALFLTLSNASRWWRFACLPLLVLGIPVAIAAYKGICVFVHISQSRNLRPWEQFGDAAAFVKSVDNDDDDDDDAALSTGDAYSMSNRSSGRKSLFLDPFGPSNSYDHEPWVEAYRRKPWSQKVFTRNVRVRNETVRSLQKKIVVQSWLLGGVIGVSFTVLVLALPKAGVLGNRNPW
ncbi:MAG: hypothetical protein LQ344_001439 [Seirophora lacunosa]|nr:MAG: hypothetical protein LQ344_001439 [Seirophora lacunosa]